MLSWFHLTAFLFSIAVGQENDQFHFTENESELSRCIEEHLLLNRRLLNWEETGHVKNIAVITAKEFSNKSLKSEDITREFEESIKNLIPWPFDQPEWLNVIEDTLKKFCSDVSENSSKSSRQLQRTDVPKFFGEEPELAEVLDHIY